MESHEVTMPDATYPGVYIEEPPDSRRKIAGVATSMAAFIGWSQEGPTSRAQLMSSWSEYGAVFGGLNSESLLSYSVYHFFGNGGRQALIARLLGDTALKPNTPGFENLLLPSSGNGGLYMLDQTGFNLLCVPAETTPPIVARLQEYCRDRGAFLIVDCDETATYESLIHGPDSSITREDASNSALYFPWIYAPDPICGDLPRALPPCGFVAGLYARTDATRGVWKAPAGIDARLVGASGITATLTDSENQVLNARAINCIRDVPTRGIVVWGGRTLRGADNLTSEWKYIPVRRLALYIEESLIRGTKWVVFEPNDETLWAQIRLNIGVFLDDLFRQGAFQGTTPRDAYFVRCDKETTTQSDIAVGIVNILVGFAPIKPAEFLIIKIQQRAGQPQA